MYVVTSELNRVEDKLCTQYVFIGFGGPDIFIVIQNIQK